MEYYHNKVVLFPLSYALKRQKFILQLIELLYNANNGIDIYQIHNDVNIQ